MVVHLSALHYMTEVLILSLQDILKAFSSSLCTKQLLHYFFFVQDYVLLVPRDLFTEDLQEDAPVPLTQAFLDSCSKDDFFIKSSDPKFCKDSVFSLTTAFSNGSRSCNCNLKGSLSSDCEQFGGQCPCRQNVIGRTCSRCKTGYYGFPNCRSKFTCSCEGHFEQVQNSKSVNK